MNAQKTYPKTAAVVSLRMVKDAEVHYNTPITSPKYAARLLHPFFKDLDREHFYVVCLSGQKEVTAINLVAVGGLNGIGIDMRNIFKPAILSNADSIIVAHNHPSGNPTFSKSDLKCTERIDEVGCLLRIDLIDHIIFYGPLETDYICYTLSGAG